MPDLERRGNFLTRALGIESYQQSVTDDFSIIWRRPNPVMARALGGLSALVHVMIPLSEVILRPDSDVTRRRLYLSAGADLAANAIAYGIAHYIDLLAGLGFKVAYNLGVEAVPDALRAVRRRFKPPAMTS
ncbi:hypothetical protein HYS96_00040 [Candidatus Daviesbacteria bacterium]|nr:hypothetical protein [Candidatus Daviesbacteria bacterium]